MPVPPPADSANAGDASPRHVSASSEPRNEQVSASNPLVGSAVCRPASIVWGAAGRCHRPKIARVRQAGQLLELDVIDVAQIDAEGRVVSMRAFFDLEGARVLG
jgi:hypothetical protein